MAGDVSYLRNPEGKMRTSVPLFVLVVLTSVGEDALDVDRGGRIWESLRPFVFIGLAVLGIALLSALATAMRGSEETARENLVSFQSDVENLNRLDSRLGEPEGMYRFARGETIIGILICIGATAGFLLIAVSSDSDFDLVAIAIGVFGPLWGVRYLFRRRRWRLVVFSGGVVQAGLNGEEKLLWTEIDAMVKTQVKGHRKPTVMVKFMARNEMVINPFNYGGQSELFKALEAAARRQGIPVVVEWRSAD